jgi:hypothetical protein
MRKGDGMRKIAGGPGENLTEGMVYHFRLRQ